MLKELLESEHRRARRLGVWTILSWASWGGCLSLLLLVPHINAVAAKPMSPVLDGVLFGVSMAALLGAMILPIVGLVLLVMFAIACRSAVSRSALSAMLSRPK